MNFEDTIQMNNKQKLYANEIYAKELELWEAIIKYGEELGFVTATSFADFIDYIAILDIPNRKEYIWRKTAVIDYLGRRKTITVEVKKDG